MDQSQTSGGGPRPPSVTASFELMDWRVGNYRDPAGVLGPWRVSIESGPDGLWLRAEAQDGERTVSRQLAIEVDRDRLMIATYGEEAADSDAILFLGDEGTTVENATFLGVRGSDLCVRFKAGEPSRVLGGSQMLALSEENDTRDLEQNAPAAP